MRAFKIPPVLAVMLAASPAPAAAHDPDFPAEAAVAGGCGGPCSCGTASTPRPTPPVPMMLSNADKNLQDTSTRTTTQPDDYVPYADQRADEACMGAAVGTATIAAGATATVNIEPTQGCFDGWYVQILAVDNAAPNTRGRVEVARFFIGDCPRECRNANVFSDVYEGLVNGCCMGVPFRAKFGKTANGEQLSVQITNPVGGFANARVQVIAKGFCKAAANSCAA